MSSTVTYVESLGDEALYKELKKYGFPAGPVVASTRNLYRRKLIGILENQEKHSDENSDNYDEPSSSQPDNTRWSHFTSSSPTQSHEQEEVSPILNLSYSSPIYRHYEDDSTKSRFSYFESQEAPRIPLSRDSTSYAFRKSLSDIKNDDNFSRIRRTHTDNLSRPELSPRYRLPGFSEEQTARMARHNRIQSKRSRRLIIFGTSVLAAVLVFYILYNIWSESDPYYQIEEEAKKLIEESDT